jgi:hypothetical protein
MADPFFARDILLTPYFEFFLCLHKKSGLNVAGISPDVGATFARFQKSR